MAASGAAMARRPPLTAEKCLRRVLISLMGAPEESRAWWKAWVSWSVICGSMGQVEHGGTAAGDEEEDERIFFGFLEQGEGGTGGGEGIFIGQRVAALKVAEAPVATLGNLVVTTDAAQAFAALHAVEKGIEHGAGGFAERDDEDAFVAGEVDGCGAAAVGQEPMERVAFKAQAAVEGGGDVAGLDGAGEDFSGRRVQDVEGGIAGRGHEHCSLSQPASDDCIAGR